MGSGALSKAYLDPGRAKPCAIAFYEGPQLVGLGTLTLEGPFVAVAGSGGSSHVEALLWEKPQVYPRSKCNPNQIVEDAVHGAMVVDRFRLIFNRDMAVRSIAPRDWKGTIKKPPHHMQFWAVLTPEEKALFPAETESYLFSAAKALALTGKEKAYSASVVDLLDAAALGAYDLGRISGPIAGRVQKRGRKWSKKRR